MYIKPFAVEEWMNEYEVGARFNIAETCVDSVSLDELFALAGADKAQFLTDFCAKRLTYGDIVGSDALRQMLKLSEFQNPLTGLNFQGTGKLTSPLGANLLRTACCPAGKIIGLDRGYALEMICGSEVMVEYDKLIDRQLERAAITSISGFAKLFPEASRVLTI